MKNQEGVSTALTFRVEAPVNAHVATSMWKQFLEFIANHRGYAPTDISEAEP
jgi:hypothetical protein